MFLSHNEITIYREYDNFKVIATRNYVVKMKTSIYNDNKDALNTKVRFPSLKIYFTTFKGV